MQSLGRGPRRLADLVGLVLSLMGTPGLRSWWEWGVVFQKQDKPAAMGHQGSWGLAEAGGLGMERQMDI